MHEGLEDTQSVFSRPNQLIDGENVINMTKSDFMPSLEILWNSEAPLKLQKSIISGKEINI